MTRGNQREIDRQRAANRHASSGGPPKDGDPLTRNANDAKALQEKKAKKEAAEKAKKEAEEATAAYNAAAKAATAAAKK